MGNNPLSGARALTYSRPPFTELPVLWPLSAPTSAALRARASALRARLAGGEQVDLLAFGRMLSATDAEHPHRAAVVAADHASLGAGLDAVVAGRPAPGTATGRVVGADVVFLFPGQGSQWDAMALDLIGPAPVFARWLRACDAALHPFTGWSVLEVLRGDPSAPPLRGPQVVQPTLFAVMLALAELWRTCGVRPAAVIGHSLGEIVAAWLAGALDLSDAARVVAQWSQAQAKLAGAGEMVFVLLGERQVRPLLARWAGRLVVAAVNGPRSVLVSGDADAADELLIELHERNVYARRADVGLAAHSAHVDAVLPQLRRDLAPICPHPPALAMYSSLTGAPLGDQPLDAEYWCRNLRRPVRFQAAVEAALARGHRVLLEVSPHPVLAAAVDDTIAQSGRTAVVRDTLRRGEGDPSRFLTALGELYVSGVWPDWGAVYADERAG